MPHSLRPVVPAPRRSCAPSFLRPVVPAPRRSCAPSSVLLDSLLLTASLLLAVSAAHAGSFVGTFTDPVSNAPSQYSGGTHYTSTGQNDQGQATFDDVSDSLYTNNSNQQGYGGGSSPTLPNGTHADCSGEIKTSWTWVPAPGNTIYTDPPPSQVVVMETSTVSVTVERSYGTGNYATGLGQSGSVSFNPPNNLTGSATDTRYFLVVVNGSTVTPAPVSPQASVTNSPANASVSYTASIVNGNWDGPYYFHYGDYSDSTDQETPWAGNTAGPTPAITDVADGNNLFSLSQTTNSGCIVEGSITPVWFWNGPDLGVPPPSFFIDVDTTAFCRDFNGKETSKDVSDGIDNYFTVPMPDSEEADGYENVPVTVASDAYAPGEGSGYWAIGPTVEMNADVHDDDGASPFDLYSSVKLTASIQSGRN